eukprot:10562129-Alexandrium_andersonii.AAC.1
MCIRDRRREDAPRRNLGRRDSQARATGAQRVDPVAQGYREEASKASWGPEAHGARRGELAVAR